MAAPGPSNTRRRFDARQIIIGTMICAGLLLVCIGVARAADWKLMVQEQGKQAEVKYIFFDCCQIACETDKAAQSYMYPKGTKIWCERITTKSEAKR